MCPTIGNSPSRGLALERSGLGGIAMADLGPRQDKRPLAFWADQIGEMLFDHVAALRHFRIIRGSPVCSPRAGAPFTRPTTAVTPR